LCPPGYSVLVSMLRIIYRVGQILYGLAAGKPMGLSDMNDVDGITSAALFKRTRPDAVVVLAYPPEVKKGVLIRRVYWDFVADLPCPGKARFRADHHETNKPCADKEYYDPEAPASALLAMRGLGLEGDPVAEALVKVAVETDTARIESREAELLDAAVKGAGYRGRLYLVERLAREGLKVIDDPRVQGWIERHMEVKRRTEEMAQRLPVRKEEYVLFEKDLGLSYRYLSILLERRGAEFTFIVVPKPFFSYRIYAGARSESQRDAAVIARRLGGGGHKYAAGALVRAFPRSRALRLIVEELRGYTGYEKIPFIVVDGRGEFREEEF